MVDKNILNDMNEFNKSVEGDDALILLSRLYRTILKVNIKKNSCERLYSKDKFMTENIDNSVSAMDLLKGYMNSGFVYEEDFDDILEFFNLDRVAEAFREGREYICCRYRRLIGGEYKWVLAEVIPATDYNSSNCTAMVLVRDIHDNAVYGISSREMLNASDTGGRLRPRILLAEDDEETRQVFVDNLSEYYDVEAVENGKKAWEILKERGKGIELILSDLIMPEMDGYTLLEKIKSDDELQRIPVIITTGINDGSDEKRCLKLGASDFIAKPCDMDIMLIRVRNILRLKESSSIINTLRMDTVTGIFSQSYFYHMANQLLKMYPDENYDIVCSDIDGFKTINERFGMSQGDAVLRFVANKYRKLKSDRLIYGRIGADIFALLIPHDMRAFETIEENLTIDGVDFCEGGEGLPRFSIRFAVYENIDRELTVQLMCDRAKMALGSIKNKYNCTVAKYDDSVRLGMLKQQRIVETMEEAVMTGQFKVWYQPKHDLKDGSLIGAEALVRWNHPDVGFIPPSDFIPLFEQNGFISRMDYFVWDKTCENIARWKSNGYKTVPISVNLSRVDLVTFKGKNIIKRLADKYDIDPKELHLEITESAYMDNPTFIMGAINRLHDQGFIIEMDDFGTGYSSLNMFGEMAIDIVKLDMRFIQQKQSDNGDKMIKFIIDMAKVMDLQVIAEGVETNEQLQRLGNMGCDYAQGYYYSKPLPAEEFELYLKKNMA